MKYMWRCLLTLATPFLLRMFAMKQDATLPQPNPSFTHSSTIKPSPQKRVQSGGKSIRKLSDQVIRKIAAGEVVERPANVVKELIENSLDSGATSIEINILDGGSKLISVQDNGSGIKAAELPLTVACHSTSKLSEFTDLSELNTMGFRGEALASISSVCKFSIQSRHLGEEQGAQLSIQNQNELSRPQILPYYGNVGTTCVCEELFFNVPARRAFLRKKATEFGHILEVVQALTLANPLVSWSLDHDGQQVFRHVPPSNTPPNPNNLDHLRPLAASLLKVAKPEKLLFIEHQNLYGSLQALITPPGIDFSSNKRMFTYVNNRWLKDRTFFAIVSRGYHTHLLKNRYPGCILFLQCEPSLVDINIHPAKKEIKFQYQREIARIIHEAIQTKLRSGSWLGDFSQTSTPASSHQEVNVLITPDQPGPTTTTINHYPEAQEHAINQDRSLKNVTSPKRIVAGAETVNSSGYNHDGPELLQEKVASSYSSPLLPEQDLESNHLPSDGLSIKKNILSENPYDKAVIPWSELVYLGLFARLYWILENPKSHQLLMVDQHAFHERIIFEQLLSKSEKLLKRQPLLSPTTVHLSPVEVGYLAQDKDKYAEIGIEFDYSHSSIQVTALPSLLVKVSHSELFEQLAQNQASSSPGTNRTWVLEDVLGTFACHSAIRAGDVMDKSARAELLRQAHDVDFYHNCPHGRRVFHVLSEREVSRWFDRI
ncbi:MAG: DNA mismatch repair endonuclease MutL [Proteobacteria bacterium]|nr:DNA mismatch repair endonuclease MutL [Pseudomonadota bacterium]